jgi:hypothetical protein
MGAMQRSFLPWPHEGCEGGGVVRAAFVGAFFDPASLGCPSCRAHVETDIGKYKMTTGKAGGCKFANR